jgi:hypothetical protein
MSYVIKKNEALINLKLTDTGRRNLAAGNFNISSFALSDAEMDYSSDNKSRINILRPQDNHIDLTVQIPGPNGATLVPVSNITAVSDEINSVEKERGFFIYENNGDININEDLFTIGKILSEPNTSSNKITLTINEYTVVNNLKSTIDRGDIVFLKIISNDYLSKVGSIDYSNLYSSVIKDPIPYLFFSILSINNQESVDLSNLSTSFELTLDRNLPNNEDYIAIAYVYPGGYAIKNYYDKETPSDYFDNSYLDFTYNNPNFIDEVPVWNFNLVTMEDIIGLDSTIYKGKFNALSRDYWGTSLYYDYFRNVNLYGKIGVIHYTNNSFSNYYGEGFYRNSFKLKIPHIMWHRKQFSSNDISNSIGYTFVCGNELKTINNDGIVRYYDLVDQEQNPLIVGKVFIDQKIVVIENKELLMTMSYKSNRNWTLPSPVLTPIEPGVCPESSTLGALEVDEAIHCTYMFIDNFGLTGAQCENYTTYTNRTDSPKDVLFEFFKDKTNQAYNEFNYLQSYTDGFGYGYRVGSIILLWQKTPFGGVPDPANWNYIFANNFIGTNGCIGGAAALNESFVLDTESSIYPLNFQSNTYLLAKKEIGEVLVSQNGALLSKASSLENLGIDGSYWVNNNNTVEGVATNSLVIFSDNLLFGGDTIQFNYLTGTSTLASSVRKDYEVPITGIPTSNTYLNGLFLFNDKTCIALENQPNNDIVYLFYNGQLISSNNYNVINSGVASERRVELNFTPTLGAKISIFYIDGSGVGTNPIGDLLTVDNVKNLRVIIDQNLLNSTEFTEYNINDYIRIPPITNLDEITFGDESFLFANVSVEAKATIYKSLITCNVLPNTFVTTENITFNTNQDKVAFTEIGFYDADADLVAVGKFSEPLVRKYNSDLLIIQATIDY